jgi:hypothetical protein
MMNLKSLLVSATFTMSIITASSICAASSDKIDYVTPESVIRATESRGASAVVSELYGNEEAWHSILRAIAKGNEAWLKVAVALRSGADAAASEMITVTIGEALEHNPEAVFKITAKTIGIAAICSGPDVDDIRYNSFALATKAINRRIARVAAINEPSQLSASKKCIQYLEASRKGIATFNGITEK